MSANNVYVIKEHKGKWYGWNEMAEASNLDRPDRVLSFGSAPYVADTEHDLKHQIEADDYMFAEYGYTTDYLPKDGTPVKFEDLP